MQQATAARCPGCGFENNPFFRYCGMCGHPLRAGEPPLPPVPQEPVLRTPEPAVERRDPVPAYEAPVQRVPRKKGPPPLAIGGLSILGLGQPEDSDAEIADREHSLEDERDSREDRDVHSREPQNGLGSFNTESGTSPSRDVGYLLEDDEPRRSFGRAFLILILLVLALGAAVWHWQANGYPWESAVRERGRRASTPEVAAPAPVETPAPVPAPSDPSGAAKPGTTPEVPASEKAAAPPMPNDEGLPAKSAAAVPPPAAEVEPPAQETPEPVVSKPEPERRAPAPQPKPMATFSPNDPAQLFAEGQKYLYGDGVPHDCDRAQRDLRTSATHSYAQAESLLGTMYASGHCLGRDLPAAYRWYARALRHDPGNSRISSDLEVLWGQMTPAERKAAQDQP